MRKNVKILKVACSLCVAIMFFWSFTHLDANAYVKNGYALSNPGSVTYRVSTTVGPYISDTITYVQKWRDYCTEIGGMTQVDANENIYFYGDLNVNNGNYAVCYHHSNDSHVITYYNLFATTESAYRYETIVHEVGHALGLAHCEAGKESSSVMRALDFNRKAYPLSDDIKGISAIY